MSGRWDSALRRAAGCCLLVTALGCGDGASLSGSVTLDGAPIDASQGVRGTLTFEPKGPGAPVAVADLDSQGRYEAHTGGRRGIAPGEYLVSVRAFRVVPPASPDDMPGIQPLTPPRYASPKTSGLSVVVEDGSNHFDVPLETQSAAVRQ